VLFFAVAEVSFLLAKTLPLIATVMGGQGTRACVCLCELFFPAAAEVSIFFAETRYCSPLYVDIY